MLGGLLARVEGILPGWLEEELRHSIIAFGGGILMAAVAFVLIASTFEEFVGATMLFASGGILYLIFQDIAPQARLERHWAPTLGAVLGFCFAMLAEMLV